ncbi:MAG TPA: EamA family transporter [Pseudonocardiaceae bacterium]|jgi:drug/metabolite transporter (DMT)-like permease|nr:EamA family transporter [Pseudonocardiaceae bacterium]
MSTNSTRPTVTRSPARGTLLVAISSICFAISGPLAAAVMKTGMTPLQLSSVRICVAAVVLLGTTAAIRPRLLWISRSALPLVVAYGLLGVAAVQLLYFVAVSRLPVGVAMLLECMSPVVVTGWTRLVRRIVLPRAVWLGVALAMGGLVLVAELWRGGALNGVGLLAGLGTTVCSAAYFLLGERGATAAHPIGITSWGLVVGAVVMTIASPLWKIRWHSLGVSTALGPWRPPVWVLLLLIVLVATVAAYVTGMAALRHLPSGVVSMLALLEPVVAIVVAWWLLGQAQTPLQIGGGVLILLGATVVQLNWNRTPVIGTEPAQPVLRPESPSARSSADAGTCPPPSDPPPGAPPARSGAYR